MRHRKGLIWVQMVTVHWFLLCKGAIYCQLPGYSIQVNSVVTVQEGLCVTIPCKFTANNRTTFTNSIGMWRNSDVTYVAYSNKSQTKFTKPNFHVVGNPDNGDCTLTITDAKKGDSGSYKFRFEESETSGNKYSYSSVVTVTVTDAIYGQLPGYSIQLNSVVTVQEGLCVTIPCKFTANNRTTFTNSTGMWSNCAGIFVAYSNKSQTEFTKPNFHAEGNPDNGDCTLTITDARKEDSGSYRFQFEESEKSANKYLFSAALTVTVTGVIYCQHPGYSIQVIRSVTVQEGLCVTIPCKFTADNRATFTNSVGMWSNCAGIYVAYSNKSQTKFTKQNFHVVGNPDNGDCKLTITDARKEDSGPYKFRFEESEKSRNKYSYSPALTVTVTDLKDKPQITVNGRLIAGKEANLTCIPPGNCNGKSPQVQWMKSDQSGTWKNASFVTFIPSKSDNQTTVTCKVTFQTGKSVTSENKTLNVLYPPSVTVTTAENQIVNTSVIGQKAVTLICIADSNPEADIAWYKESIIVNRSKSSVALQINNTSPTPTTVHTIYACLAWNELGANLTNVDVFLQGTTSNSQSFFQETTVRDMLTGVACGIIISLIIVFLLLKCLRNQPTLTSVLNHTQGFPSPQDFPPDDNNQLYAQVREPQLQAPESSNESSDLNDVSYASVKFSKTIAKGTPKQPETEYSEIRFQ